MLEPAHWDVEPSSSTSCCVTNGQLLYRLTSLCLRFFVDKMDIAIVHTV